MGKTSTKLAGYALVQLLLFHLSGLVAAAEVFYRSRADACTGPGYMYERMSPYVCAQAMGTAGSVEVIIDETARAAYYGQGFCCGLIFILPGPYCAVGGVFTGVVWVPGSSLTEFAEDDCYREKACDAQTKPTGIVYSEESTEGRWILTTDNATEMYTQMDAIPDAQKVDWLQGHGATFKLNL